MITMPGTYLTSPTLVWVCVDCMLDQNGLREQDEDPRPETWALYEGQDVEITSGMLFEHHEEGCANFTADGEWLGTGDETCERIEFTWSACEACGSTQGGSREAFTVWYPNAAEVAS